MAVKAVRSVEHFFFHPFVIVCAVIQHSFFWSAVALSSLKQSMLSQCEVLLDEHSVAIKKKKSLRK